MAFISSLSRDMIFALALMATTAFMIVAYRVRKKRRGAAHFDRIDKMGGSALVSKDILEMAYWFVQPLARLLVFLRITPNMLSWSSFFLGLIAGTCLAFGHFGSGAVFATIACIMDALDGIVARTMNLSSDAGEVLDASLDRYVEFFFYGGLLFYYRQVPAMLLVTFAALVGSFMISYSTAKAEALQCNPPKGPMRRPERSMYLIIGAVFSPVTIPLFEMDRTYAVPVGHPMVLALCLIAVLANVSAAERLYAVAKQIRAREAEEKEKKAKELLNPQLEAESESGVSEHPMKAR